MWLSNSSLLYPAVWTLTILLLMTFKFRLWVSIPDARL